MEGENAKLVQVMLRYTGKYQEDFVLMISGRTLQMDHKWDHYKELKQKILKREKKKKKMELWWAILMVNLARSGIG